MPDGHYGPVQLCDQLGIDRFQFDRARAAGIIGDPDRSKGRWSAAVATELKDQIDEIRAVAGTIPDLGAVRAAEVISARLGITITCDAIPELAARGRLTIVGDFKGHPLYCGHSLEAFTDTAAAITAQRDGELLTSDEAAERLQIRRADFDHLVRAGYLSPARYGRSIYQRHENVALYRARDLTAVEQRDDIDWAVVRSTPKGHQSPLTKLPTAQEATQ
ncbi:hypothetical protein BJF79_03290 [Actinomadura sp. CNU-125]|uniref:helix-turn-helix domain-containing protein n=1 Tax=Actinomadura sp. CNU-125 TaxID=1904961 RepID=UPI0009625B77|nr:helix-turn-helix domain-containing protein [Actinomadura sp. CNU-125]OLT12937.1 hypothetical protein BJF79_03290 [Actinomadura sp. CNU-125]